MKKIVLALVLSIFMVSVAFAAGDSTNEAKLMVEKAVNYIKVNGKDKAMAEFNNQKGAFIVGYLYIFVVDFNGITMANGGTPALVGKDVKGLQDSDGKLFIAEMIELAKTKGKGWVNYNWVNRVSKKIEPKTSYIQKVDNYFVGCGISGI